MPFCGHVRPKPQNQGFPTMRGEEHTACMTLYAVNAWLDSRRGSDDTARWRGFERQWQDLVRGVRLHLHQEKIGVQRSASLGQVEIESVDIR